MTPAPPPTPSVSSCRQRLRPRWPRRGTGAHWQAAAAQTAAGPGCTAGSGCANGAAPLPGVCGVAPHASCQTSCAPLLCSSHPRVGPIPCRLQADDADSQQALRAELQGQLQWLVQNYGSRRASLLEEILPEVGRAGAGGQRGGRSEARRSATVGGGLAGGHSCNVPADRGGMQPKRGSLARLLLLQLRCICRVDSRHPPPLLDTPPTAYNLSPTPRPPTHPPCLAARPRGAGRVRLCLAR